MSIDLSTAVVGDNFDSLNERYELLMKSEKDYVIKGCGARLYIVNRHGSSYEPDAVKLVSKHDPRHWLGQLPDADLFVSDIKYLACSKENGWVWFINEPFECVREIWGSSFRAGDIDCFKMPTLTGDEWKQSKISIDELRAWQKLNK
jgi:hypothetical protein